VPIPKSQKSLTALFEKLGAPEPESWATSQATEGIPQLLRFLFLREAWRYVQDENDHSWIERAIERAKQHPNEPYAQVGGVFARCRAHGVSDQDLTDLTRCNQAAMMFHMCYVIDSGPEDVPEDLEDVAWGLFRVNASERPVGASIDALHESVLATDPTGREMRPRDAC
jgi:hypothetical protein